MTDAKDIAEELQETSVVDGSDGAVEPESDTKPEEKMLPVSRVNELIKKAKHAGERKMQEQLDQAQQQIQQLQAGQQAPQAQAPQPPQQQGMTQEQIQAHVMQAIQAKMAEEKQRQEQEALEKEVNEVAKSYFGKIAQGKEAFEDFDAVTASFDPAAFPQLVYLATQTDNTAAIIYELQKNPAKLAQLSVLVDKSPQMARTEIAKLSQSIKTNEDAKKNLKEAQDPLNRLKPSVAGTDNGKMNLRDLKKSPHLRG
jgi:hypothetical protein